MNAYEIVQNIITDGINQSKESIWARLLISDFDMPNPKNNSMFFETPEKYLDSELYKLALNNYYFEKEYYAVKPLMSEEEYDNANFSQYYKQYVPDYFEYKKKWKLDRAIIFEVGENRNEIIKLLDLQILNKNTLQSLKLSRRAQSVIGGSPFLHNYTFQEVYNNSKALWEKSRTEEGRKNVLYKCECNWFYHIHKILTFEFKGDVIAYRQKELDIKLNYVNEWNRLKKSQERESQAWEAKKSKHCTRQKRRKLEVESLRIHYLRLEPDAIVRFYKEILENSKYQFEFKKEVEIDYNPKTKILMVEYALPNIEKIPNIKETRYLKSKNEYKNMFVSQRDLLKLFDEAIYCIILRSIYEVLKVDTIKAIAAINFNGWIKSVNKATGKKENTCIVSIQVKHDEFKEVELENVDPKMCFKHFKGVGSSKLHGITAIQPILQIQKDDKRFVASQDIELDESTNLALMDWEDFEHLIRELFEKEFTSNGGEVKVTQASRDGGVDAIAFDPDPIRGGKIVIQAKRYTNTVGVSAVRDLYGTIMNEGANKGILVTTSDYGSDSYEFAKGKPITLLNGANLLYLLEKHGTYAKIDIKEAKRILGENK